MRQDNASCQITGQAVTFVDLQSRLGSCSGSGVRPHRMGRVPARMRPGPAALRSVSARRKSTAFPPKMATTTLAIVRIIQESSSYYGNPVARANGPLGAAEPQWAVVTVPGCPSVPLIPLSTASSRFMPARRRAGPRVPRAPTCLAASATRRVQSVRLQVDLQLMVFFYPRRAENRTFRPPVTQKQKNILNFRKC